MLALDELLERFLFTLDEANEIANNIHGPEVHARLRDIIQGGPGHEPLLAAVLRGILLEMEREANAQPDRNRYA